MSTETKMYRGADGSLRDWRAHVAYLRECATLWASGKFAWEPDTEKASQLRARAREIEKRHKGK